LYECFKFNVLLFITNKSFYGVLRTLIKFAGFFVYSLGNVRLRNDLFLILPMNVKFID